MGTKLTKKGQIVIPINLRKKYRLQTGSEVELMDIGGEIVIVPLTIKNPIDAAKGLLKGGLSTRKLLQIARKEERKLEKR